MRLRNHTLAAEAIVAPISRVSIDSLPNEILYRILEFVGSECPAAQGAYGHWSRSSLLHAALVCRRWRHPAQETLFGWALVSVREPEKIARWIGLEPASHARVRSLIIKDLTTGTDGVPTCAAALLESPHINTLVVTSILSYWPYLYHLKALKRLHMIFCIEPLEEPTDDLPSPFPFQLDALCFDITHEVEDDTLVQIIPPEVVPILAEACTSLRSLQLNWVGNYQAGNTPHILALLQPLLDASSTSLRHLRMDGGTLPIEIYTALGVAIKECVHFDITVLKEHLPAVLEALAASGFCANLERLTIRPDYRAINRNATGENDTLELLRREERLPRVLLGVLQSASFARLRHVFLPRHYRGDSLTSDEGSRDILQDLEARGVEVFAGKDLPLY